MKNRKTFTNWLTNKYLLVIRNEEDFAEKSSITFTYARVFLLIFLSVVLIFLLSLYMVKTILSQWFNPRHEQMETNRNLVELRIKLDSLEHQVQIKDQFITNIGKILKGEDTLKADNGLENEEYTASEVERVFSDDFMRIDSTFRQQFEQSEQSFLTVSNYTSDLTDLYLYSPVNGIVSSKFDMDLGHYGVDIVAGESEVIKSVADGTVIFSSWTLDGGYVIGIQHRANLVSVYKHNSVLTKKTGNFVRSGEQIAIIGNSGELTTGPHLHFELWYNGDPVDPEDFVSF